MNKFVLIRKEQCDKRVKTLKVPKRMKETISLNINAKTIYRMKILMIRLLTWSSQKMSYTKVRIKRYFHHQDFQPNI